MRWRRQLSRLKKTLAGGCLRVVARNGAARVQAYTRLQKALRFYQRVAWLPFTDAAATFFDQLRAQKLHLGTNDLCIAAIALSVRGVLVTRNSKDFRRIPDLVVEDWTI